MSKYRVWVCEECPRKCFIGSTTFYDGESPFPGCPFYSDETTKFKQVATFEVLEAEK